MAKRIMLQDIEKAVEYYYKYFEIGTPEIMQLFGCSRYTALQLKKTARELQEKNGKQSFSSLNVNTRCAYKAWGIDIDDIERRVLRLQSFRRRSEENTA